MLGAEAEALRVKYTATAEDMLQQACAMVTDTPMSHTALAADVSHYMHALSDTQQK
jgi:hypothetical protein